MPPQLVETLGEEFRDRRQLERHRSERLLIRRQRYLAELDLATWTPGDDPRRAGTPQPLDRVVGDAPGCLRVAALELLDTAADGVAAHHLIGHAEPVEHIEHEQRDVRRLDHIAAGVEDDVRCRVVLIGGTQRRRHPLQHFGRELQPRDDPGAVRHADEVLLCAAPHGGLAGPGLDGDPRHVDKKTRVYAVVAGGDAFAAIRAHLGPTLGLRGSRPATDEVEEAVGDGRRVRSVATGVDACGGDHRAGGNAFAATGAGVDAGLDPSVQSLEKRGTARRRHAVISAMCADA